MDYAIAKHFRREQEKAIASYPPTSSVYIEQKIGVKAHIQRAMPLFLTLRDNDGDGFATAILPPGGQNDTNFKIIIVGRGNRGPYVGHGEAIEVLGKHYGMTLKREDCYPYNR